MQQATSQPDTVFEETTLKFLTIIDLNVANETSIYSTLLFFIEEAKRIGISNHAPLSINRYGRKYLQLLRIKISILSAG